MKMCFIVNLTHAEHSQILRYNYNIESENVRISIFVKNL